MQSSEKVKDNRNLSRCSIRKVNDDNSNHKNENRNKEPTKHSKNNIINNDDTVSHRHIGIIPVRGLQAFAKKAMKQQEQDLKPVYISKKQRMLQNEKENEKKSKFIAKKTIELEKKHNEFIKNSILSGRNQNRKSNSYSKDNSRSYQSRSEIEREKRLRQETREKRESDRLERKKIETEEKIKKDIKDSYLGNKRAKKRVMPPSQKFRFNFDWELTDDTSQDLNDLYQKKHEISLQFGRGFIAGIDRNLQKEHNTIFDKFVEQHKESDPKLRKEIREKHKERINRTAARIQDFKKKNRHQREKKLKEMEARDQRIFKEDFNISTRGINVPNPIRFQRESSLPKEIIDTLRKVRYQDPTPIQRMAIPIGLNNRDCVGIAETGSGKTAAFLLPMLVYISKLPPMTPQMAVDGPYAIILAPSRELAQQIEDECSKFAGAMGIRSVSIIGGISFQNQAIILRDGAEIIIGTPGRLQDCIERRFIVLNQCNYIVLDEADRMIDMGFEPQVVAVMNKMPSSNLRPENPDDVKEKHQYRQTFMFSATMPLSVEKLTKNYLRNPIFIAVGERGGKTADKIKQNVIQTSDNLKRKQVQQLLETLSPPVMIFCNLKKECDALAKHLNSQNFNTAAMHGGKIQEQREHLMESFKSGEIDILVCTNVAGRGIDVKGVTHVINYDMPSTIEDYTHRIGRTGRAGAEGEATTYLTEKDSDIFYDFKKLLLDTGNAVPRELMDHPLANTLPGQAPKQKVIFTKF